MVRLRYVRVHVRGKRWPAAHTVDWADRVRHLAEAFVVVDKAPGVQCVPSVDNVQECVPACVERVRHLIQVNRAERMYP